MKLKLLIKISSTGVKEVETDSDATVAEFKEALAPVTSIPAAQQRLIHRGHLLKEEKLLSDYGNSQTSHKSVTSHSMPRAVGFTAMSAAGLHSSRWWYLPTTELSVRRLVVVAL